MPDTSAVAWLTKARREFHASILNSILTLSDKGVPSNADKGSRPSVEIASAIVAKMGVARTAPKLPGQTSGADFEEICAGFIGLCLDRLGHLRPGRFSVTKGGAIAQFDQYAHLDELEAISKSNREIATALGSDYLIKPDIVVARQPESDARINARECLVDADAARLSALRAVNQPMPILHASLSCKWTLRSDRAQNARSEGLNLVRNRKGRLPHIAVITGEPTPGRIASLALGTGDIDCVYHFALYELRAALVDQGRDDTLELLDTMIAGKRLRDISDLPLDLVT
ncbi:NgoMIV family type II restriction endonuclease [Marinovum sp. 2_MG-2023]|uniref:NgoMIV family type II restriction endonuclease n=1 Tax=unclassified Marinovum TaxID=2647166 RepID=UPI0026E26DB3|nr:MULTISPECIES: NgoMIV family type II restriction endonuclease [unclassified Marinovum]MDO6728416.1 NgoMIV family type II restriction endonuclease [Marinovum sp. 2_MG-2023]MDO6778168.1 NgoMIV family type II restriction endonuclease [Marinovum sp. 1_MG-2023]